LSGNCERATQGNMRHFLWCMERSFALVNPHDRCRGYERVQNRSVMIVTRPSSGHSITDPTRRVNRSDREIRKLEPVLERITGVDGELCLADRPTY
jgi:hypothetical protein